MKLALRTAILFVMIFASAAYGQQQGLSFNFFGGGARSEGMGQAYLSVSDDGTAGSWNPAGLQIQEKTLMSFSYSFHMPRGKYTYDSYVGSDVNVYEYDHDGTIGAINYWHIVSPIRVKGHHFVLDVGYTRNFDVYYKFGEALFSDWAGDEPNSFYERKGGINSINLAFGTKILKNISFGVAANIYAGKIVTTENRHFERLGYTALDSALYSSDVEILDSASYTGFNANIGFLYQSERFNMGLLVRTPYKLKSTSDSSQYRISTKNGVTITEDDWGLDGFNIFQTDTIYIDDISARLEMPLSLGFGLSYLMTENWLLSGDVEYKAFDGKKIESLEYKLLSADGGSEEVYTDTLVLPKWNNVMQFRLGTEYTFNTKFGAVPVRFGFRNEAIPTGDIIGVNTEFGSTSTGAVDSNLVYYRFEYSDDKVTGYSFSLGTGIHWEQIQLDVAYTISSYDQSIYQKVNEVDNGEITTVERLHSKNEWNDHHLNLTFTGYF